MYLIGILYYYHSRSLLSKAYVQYARAFEHRPIIFLPFPYFQAEAAKKKGSSSKTKEGKEEWQKEENYLLLSFLAFLHILPIFISSLEHPEFILHSYTTI